jgi:arginyl-tRNA synthetase
MGPQLLPPSYGMVYLPEGKMKSREGKVVDADDLIAGMVDLAEAEIRKRDPEASFPMPRSSSARRSSAPVRSSTTC